MFQFTEKGIANMSKRLDSEDLDILSNSYVRLVAPVDDKTGEVQASYLDIDSASNMRIAEIYLDDLPSKSGCLEIIKKNNFENNNKLEEIAKRKRQYYRITHPWYRIFVKSLPNLAYHIDQLPRECTFSVQIEVVRALCRDRNFWFGDPAAFRDFCNDPDRSYEIYGKEVCERIRAFINDFVKDLYLRLREPSTRKKIRDTRKGAKKRAKEYRKYVLRLLAVRTPLNVIRIDLAYKKGVKASIEKIIEDLKHFHRNMRHNPRLFMHIFGYIEKIEYGLSKGIHVHLLLFYTSERQSSSNVYLAQSIGEYWVNEITHGNGHYWNNNAYEDHYRRLGRLGIGEIHAHDAAGIYWLCHDVDYFCKEEQFIKPIANPKTKLLRRGAMPELSSPKRGRPRKSPTAEMTGGNTPSSIPIMPPISPISPLPDNYPYPNQLPWSGSLKINTNI